MNDKKTLTRRDLLVKMAYTAPLIVTLTVMPSIASAGSPVTPPSGRPAHHHNKWHPW